jgi:3-isopropylmalate dehydrogenase
MLLRYSLELDQEAAAVEQAVDRCIANGARTADIAEHGRPAMTTRRMGDAVLAAIG